jgi:hypothetical protein
MAEIWREFEEKRLCALTNEECGWLMWFACDGDAGYSSRGDLRAQGQAQFRLGNGQLDFYPRAWTLSLETIDSALAHFDKTGERDPLIDWHNDGQ